MKRIIFIIAIILSSITFPVTANANDSTEVNTTNTILQKQELKLPWYKNMNYTFGYNIGLCLRGEDLNYYPHGGVDVVGSIVGMFYWLNSIEAGVRIPINNRIIETGLGYGWADIGSGGSGDFETRFADTLINNSSANWANLIFGKINKLSLYLSSAYKHIISGLEFNYCQGYGTEIYYYGSSTEFQENVRRDLIGGGGYIKLSPIIILNEYSRINPYLMFKISGSYEIHSTSPYSGLWDKKLTVWYTGLYGGFNFNIGGKR